VYPAGRPEDQFLFLLTHFARHYRGSGVGCRPLVDLYVFRKAFPGMGEAYLSKELEKLHLNVFCDNVLRTARVWFEGADTDPVTDRITDFLFSGGIWGSSQFAEQAQAVKANRKRGRDGNAGIRALFRAVFPNKDSLQYRYPVLNRFPWLLPLMWVIRWLDILILRPKRLRKRLADLKIIDDASIEKYRRALEEVGLDFYFE